MSSARARLRGREYLAATDEGATDFHVTNMIDGDSEQIFFQHNDVRQKVCPQHSLAVLGERGVGPARGVGDEGLFECDLLLGDLFVRVLAVEGSSGDRGVDAEQGI